AQRICLRFGQGCVRHRQRRAERLRQPSPTFAKVRKILSEILIDTGPLVAVICAGDRDHAWTVERFRALPPPFLTCEAVIAEACFLIERRGVSGAVILEKIENDLLRIALEIEDHSAALRKLMTRYARVPMSLADSWLGRLSAFYPEF